MIYFFYFILFSFAFFVGLVFGEVIASKKPKSSFSKWWRKRVISDGDLEGLD